MTSEPALDTQKPWVLIASLAMILAFSTVAVLLVRSMSAPVTAAAPASGPPDEAAHEQLPSDAEDAPPMPAAQLAEQASPEPAPSGPATPRPDADAPAADEATVSEQRTFKSRRALETIDPRELLRRSAVPPANILK